MNFSLYIAKRYFISKKSQNAINIISAISVFGLAVGAMALVVILSVFNGFDGVIKSLYNSFNPDLLVTISEGKSFTPDTSMIKKIKALNGVMHIAEVIEENALIQYGEKQHVARLKGVSENFNLVTGVDTMMTEGSFILTKQGEPYAIVGQGAAYYLTIGLNFVNPLIVYVPKRLGNITIDPTQSLKKKYIFPSGIFSIQQEEFDSRYIILPISFVRDLLDYNNEVTALEIKLNENYNIEKTKNEIKELLGDKFVVKNRYEQNELFYKIMKSEKWAIYLILTFILIVASFNIIGSLTMLILEKKKDILILQSLGANSSLVSKIFFFEGSMISIIGGILGLIFGVLVCWIQQKFEIIQLQGSGSFIIEAYPVDIQIPDVFLVFGIVLFIGVIAAIIPSRFITKRYFNY